jgi:putative protease
MEITAPAGNFEKLQYALAYNADAVYLAGQQYGLRAFAGNFSPDELKKAVEYSHALGRKAYLTLNVFSMNADIEALPEHLQEIGKIPFDAVIVSEPGTLDKFSHTSQHPGKHNQSPGSKILAGTGHQPCNNGKGGVLF